MDDALFFRQVRLGSMANYIYLIGDARTREVAVIDPAWDVQGILDLAAQEDVTITHALITHYHPDHVGGEIFGHHIEGLAALMEKHPVPVVVHRKEAEGVAQVTGLSRSDLQTVEGGDVLKIGDIPIRFLHTPGHTPGSQCFLVGDDLIAGDTLFIGGCGRVDLPGGDPGAMYESLTGVLMKLPDTTRLFPGHAYGPKADSTMGEEKRTNRYLRVPDKETWLSFMGR